MLEIQDQTEQQQNEIFITHFSFLKEKTSKQSFLSLFAMLS